MAQSYGMDATGGMTTEDVEMGARRTWELLVMASTDDVNDELGTEREGETAPATPKYPTVLVNFDSDPD